MPNHHVATSIKVVSQVPVEYSTIKYHNIFKDLFVTRVTKFQTTAGNFVFELLNTIKSVLNRKDFLFVLGNKKFD